MCLGYLIYIDNDKRLASKNETLFLGEEKNK
jgi:hypothetical protein